MCKMVVEQKRLQTDASSSKCLNDIEDSWNQETYFILLVIVIVTSGNLD